MVQQILGFLQCPAPPSDPGDQVLFLGLGHSIEVTFYIFVYGNIVANLSLCQFQRLVFADPSGLAVAKDFRLVKQAR